MKDGKTSHENEPPCKSDSNEGGIAGNTGMHCLVAFLENSPKGTVFGADFNRCVAPQGGADVRL
jgi:hypothetical protein